MRPIDADALIEWFMPFLHEDEKIDPDTVISDIRAFPTITPPPNDSLTLDELREMDGEPVWVEHYHGGEWITVHWDIYGEITTAYKACLRAGEYGKRWLAYRRKPEEGK